MQDKRCCLIYVRVIYKILFDTQRLKILTIPWRDTQHQRNDLSTMANGAIRQSFIAEHGFDITKDPELSKEQTEVMIQSREGIKESDPPPEPV